MKALFDNTLFPVKSGLKGSTQNSEQQPLTFSHSRDDLMILYPVFFFFSRKMPCRWRLSDSQAMPVLLIGSRSVGFLWCFLCGQTFSHIHFYMPAPRFVKGVPCSSLGIFPLLWLDSLSLPCFPLVLPPLGLVLAWGLCFCFLIHELD